MTRLAIERVSKRFGGLRVLHDVSFDVPEATVVGLIGPNGAGKTTLLNIVSGALVPSAGRVLFDGEDTTGWSSHRRAAAGLARTFQLMRPFASMTVLGNVEVPALLRHARRRDARRTALEVIERVGLGEDADTPAAELPTAGRKRLELARALALEPRVVLLDEVLSGLTPPEREPLIALLRGLRDEGLALVFVEHVMAAVVDLCDRVVVLHHGEVLAGGSAADVMQDPRVVEAYLGGDLALAAR